jgi:D-alanine-D-alanine ligase
VTGRRVRVAVVFAGADSARGTAMEVLAALDPERFEALPVVLGPSAGAAERSLRSGGPRREALAPAGGPRAVAGVSRSGTSATSLLPAASGADAGLRDLSGVDLVVPVTAAGEPPIDGLLEMAGLPYVGAGVFASAVARDRQFTRKLIAVAGVPVVPHATLRDGEEFAAADRRRLGLPVAVRPATAGPEVRNPLIHDWDDLVAAVTATRTGRSKVLVEAAVPGRRIISGVLPGAPATASVCGEVRAYEGDELFDVAVPVAVPDEVAHLAVRACAAVECAGPALVEFVLTADGPLFTELNATPSLAPGALLARLWAASEVSYVDLVNRVVGSAR